MSRSWKIGWYSQLIAGQGKNCVAFSCSTLAGTVAHFPGFVLVIWGWFSLKPLEGGQKEKNLYLATLVCQIPCGTATFRFQATICPRLHQEADDVKMALESCHVQCRFSKVVGPIFVRTGFNKDADDLQMPPMSCNQQGCWTPGGPLILVGPNLH